MSCTPRCRYCGEPTDCLKNEVEIDIGEGWIQYGDLFECGSRNCFSMYREVVGLGKSIQFSRGMKQDE